MKHKAQAFEVRTELAKSVRKKRGLSISRYGTSNPVNSLLDSKNENIPKINRKFADNSLKKYFFTKLVQNHFPKVFC